MKTLEIKDILKKDLLIIETSEQITLTITATGYMLRDNSTNEDFFIEGCTLLGKPDEISEEDAVGLVKMGSYITTFWNYKTNDNHKSNQLRTAKESLLSLLESEIYWENPFPYEKTESELMADNLSYCRFMTKEESKFWEAQENTFDRNRTLIFKKN